MNYTLEPLPEKMTHGGGCGWKTRAKQLHKELSDAYEEIPRLRHQLELKEKELENVMSNSKQQINQYRSIKILLESDLACGDKIQLLQTLTNTI